MFCKKCGSKLTDDQLFCSVCGEKIIKEQQEPKTIASNSAKNSPSNSIHKKHQKVRLLFFSILDICLVASLFALKWYFSPEQELKRSLAIRDYEKAYQICINTENINIDELTDALLEEMDEIKFLFQKGSIDYEVASKKLNAIKEMDLSQIENELNDSITYIEKINQSMKAYTAALSYEEQGDHGTAISLMRQVVVEDRNYEEAQIKLKEIVEQYRQNVLAQVDLCETEKNYNEAIEILRDALNLFPSDVDLMEKLTHLESISSSMRTDINLETYIPQQLYTSHDKENAMLGYMNIVLLGMETANDKLVEKNSRCRTILIASINLNTNDIKLISVYANAYLNIDNDTYTQCSIAHAKGGPQQTIKMLNSNLDMDIENFIQVGYNAVIDIIDGLGGIYVDVKDNILENLNQKQRVIVAERKYGVKISTMTTEEDLKVVKESDYTPVTQGGYQLLNGLQAVAYCEAYRFSGEDYNKRTEVQRTVLKAILNQAKNFDKKYLTDVFTDGFRASAYTSFGIDEIVELVNTDYSIVDESNFPNEAQSDRIQFEIIGYCIAPRTLTSNVEWLHEFLFEDENYQVTTVVEAYSEKIEADVVKALYE